MSVTQFPDRSQSLHAFSLIKWIRRRVRASKPILKLDRLRLRGPNGAKDEYLYGKGRLLQHDRHIKDALVSGSASAISWVPGKCRRRRKDKFVAPLLFTKRRVRCKWILITTY
jgi:hypothetical protein